MPTHPSAATGHLAGRDGSAKPLAVDLVYTSTRLVRLVSSQLEIPLSISQTRAMASLRDLGPLRISALAASQRCAQPSMTALVDRLEAAGLARRSADPADARAVLVSLTDAGREQLDVAGDAMAEVLAVALAALEPADRDVLADGLTVLHRVIEGVRSSIDDRDGRR